MNILFSYYLLVLLMPVAVRNKQLKLGEITQKCHKAPRRIVIAKSDDYK
jgi:hypothetical protein